MHKANTMEESQNLFWLIYQTFLSRTGHAQVSDSGEEGQLIGGDVNK